MRILHTRRAFTLVELLVSIALIILIMSLAVAFLPRREVRLATQGADQLQTYIASAKSRALRDRSPRGIRLIQGPQGDYREFQFIEVPEPYAPAAQVTVFPASSTPAPGPYPMRVYFDLTGSVDAGDMIEFPSSVQDTTPHRVVSSPVWNGSFSLVYLASVPPNALTGFYSTANFRFVRQARPLLGEPVLQLPSGVLVELDSSQGGRSLNVPTSWSGQRDILFSSSGQVINANAGRIVLWVRDDNNVSQPTLLTIYAYTGGVAAHPQCTDPTKNPYFFTQDGRSSGQ